MYLSLSLHISLSIYLSIYLCMYIYIYIYIYVYIYRLGAREARYPLGPAPDSGPGVGAPQPSIL